MTVFWPEQPIHFECPRLRWPHQGEEFPDFEPGPEQLRFVAFGLQTTGRHVLQQECCISEIMNSIYITFSFNIGVNLTKDQGKNNILEVLKLVARSRGRRGLMDRAATKGSAVRILPPLISIFSRMDWIFSGGINASNCNNPYRNKLFREEKPILNEA